jgi:hypothetical protein
VLDLSTFIFFDVIVKSPQHNFCFFSSNQFFLFPLQAITHIFSFQRNFICFVSTNSLFHELSLIKVCYPKHDHPYLLFFFLHVNVVSFLIFLLIPTKKNCIMFLNGFPLVAFLLLLFKNKGT